MARCLFVVEDTFFIKGRGLVLVPGIISQGEERFRTGDPILLKRPDGILQEARIGGLESFMTPTPREDTIILLKGCDKVDVPIGTEVWSVDASKPSEFEL